MKLNVFTLILAASAFGAVAANADELVIKERVAPGVTIQERVGSPSVIVRERETTGWRDRDDCTTKTVRKTDADHDSTKVVKTTKCD